MSKMSSTAIVISTFRVNDFSSELESTKCKHLTDEKEWLLGCVAEQGKEIKKLKG